MAKKHVVRTCLSICICAAMLYTNTGMSQPVGLPSMGSASATELSPRIEKVLGDAIMEQGYHDPTYIADIGINQYLTALGHNLANYAPKPLEQTITVFAVRDSSINAFAMPGGYIGVNTGLFAAANSESELAGVVAHEIGHVMQRHIARGLSEQSKSTGIIVASIVGAVLAAIAGQPDLAMGVATFGQAAGIDRQLGFSRSAEQEADRAGLQMLARAGYSPKGMADMFKNLMRAANLNEGMRNTYASTHPLSIQRLSDIENRLSSLPSASPTKNTRFWFVKTALMVKQVNDNASKNQLELALKGQLDKYQGARLAALYYGLALLAQDAENLKQANEYISLAKKTYKSPAIDLLEISLATGSNNLQLAQNAVSRWPNEQALAYEYAAVLQQHSLYKESVTVLDTAIQKWPGVFDYQKLLAKAYQKLGQHVQANEAMASYYEQTGALATAVEHLEQARAQSSDFYAQSRIDTRIRKIRDRLDMQRDLLKPFER